MTELRDVPISAMVEQTLRDDIRRLAEENDRTFSAEVRRALRLYVLGENVLKGREPDDGS